MPIAEITQESVAAAIAGRKTSVRSLNYGPIVVRLSALYKRMVKARREREAVRHDPRLWPGRARATPTLLVKAGD